MEDDIYPGDIDADKLPIEFNRYIDKFVLEAPNGETYYFRAVSYTHLTLPTTPYV